MSKESVFTNPEAVILFVLSELKRPLEISRLVAILYLADREHYKKHFKILSDFTYGKHESKDKRYQLGPYQIGLDVLVDSLGLRGFLKKTIKEKFRSNSFISLLKKEFELTLSEVEKEFLREAIENVRCKRTYNLFKKFRKEEPYTVPCFYGDSFAWFVLCKPSSKHKKEKEKDKYDSFLEELGLLDKKDEAFAIFEKYFSVQRAKKVTKKLKKEAYEKFLDELSCL